MLVAIAFYKFSKVHKEGLSGAMSPFENMNAKLYVKVSGSGKISEIEEHRGALPILERRKLVHKRTERGPTLFCRKRACHAEMTLAVAV